MAYPSSLSSCNTVAISSSPPSYAPRQPRYRTLAIPSSLSPWNARHNGGGDDVGGMQTGDWPKARWRHGGESLYAPVCNPPLNPLLSRSRILLSPTPCYARRGAIGIEKWCTPVQSHSFPRLSDPRSCRVPLSSPSSSFINSSDSPRYPLIAIKIIRTLFLFTLSYTSGNFFPFHLVSWDFKFLQWG